MIATEEAFVSVVVPVYNAKATLEDCLDSLLNQTLASYEIILVDDGSTDGTAEIARVYQNRFPQIRLFHQENSGAWNARLCGIRLAIGQYIAFCDSDDTVQPTWLAKMCSSIEEFGSDFCVCGYTRVSARSAKAELCWLKRKNYPCIDKNVFAMLNTALWNKLFHHSMLDNISSLPHPPKVGEDTLFLSVVYSRAQSFCAVPEALYQYRAENPLSAQPSDLKRTQESFLILKQTCNFASQMDFFVFLHCGFVVPYLIGAKQLKQNWGISKDTHSFLNAHFPLWKRGCILPMILRTSPKKQLIRLMLIRCVYRVGTMPLFLWFFQWIRRKGYQLFKW